MKKFIFILTALCTTLCLYATPALQEWRTFRQSDGSTIRVKLCGDETMHYYITEDNVPLVREANGDFCYASSTGFRISSTGILAHEAPARNATERRNITSIDALASLPNWKRDQMNLHRAERAMKTSKLSASLRANRIDSEPVKRKGLVIMVSFPDREFSSEDSYQEWKDILSKPGYSLHEANGCVEDYFRDQSLGALDINFDLVGPYMMSNESTYYGKYNAPGGDDFNCGEMIVDACKMADADVNFADYDWDGDGTVEQVFILYAGTTAARTGNDQNLIWPHEWVLEAYPATPNGLTLDSVVINTYAVGSELLNRDSELTPPILSGLGTFCHEFAHCLGLADLYSTNGRGNPVLDEWSLLCNGSYNNMGWCPPNLSLYEKQQSGWLEIPVLQEPASIRDMGTVNATNQGYIVRNDCGTDDINEFYLIEARNQDGWDNYTPGKGVLIYHIDYDKEAWNFNTINNVYSHPRFTIISADGIPYTSANNTYPYGKRDSLTNYSNPSAKVYNQNVQGNYFMNQPITNITFEDGVASFDFCGGNTPSAITDTREDLAASPTGQPVTIYDAKGRKIKETEHFNGLSGLPQGIYILKGQNFEQKTVYHE